MKSKLAGTKTILSGVTPRGSIRRRKERSRTTRMSEKSSSGMDIPDYAIERIARCLLPIMQSYFESEEGQHELEQWKSKE